MRGSRKRSLRLLIGPTPDGGGVLEVRAGGSRTLTVSSAEGRIKVGLAGSMRMPNSGRWIST